MELQNEIDLDLWKAVSKKYEVEDYSGAIIDAFLSLTETIRDKSGLEGDGSSLVGQAFGGNNPKIKLNKLQTDSERDIQRGSLDLLKGLYTSIRNPRHHDISNDNKATADSIICFVDYLLKIIDNSKQCFDEREFLARVFDKYYVKTNEYSKLLVNEIPTRQRANIAISVVMKRNEGNLNALASFMSALFEKMEEVEKVRVCRVIGDELKTTTDNKDICALICMCPGTYWTYLDEAVRLRTEAIVFSDFENARFNSKNSKFGAAGWLSAWITTDHLMRFNQLAKWTRQAIAMLESGDADTTAFIHKFFWNKICRANRDEITWPLQQFFSEALDENDEDRIDLLEREIKWDHDHPWWSVFEKQLKAHPEIQYEELPF